VKTSPNVQSDERLVELFDLMGFHLKTGEELKPVDRQIVDEWRGQSSKIVRRVPSRIDPDKFGFFDQVSGSAKVWFWVSDAGDYEFYDGPGFHPRTGEEFKIVTRDTIAAWRQAVEAKLKAQERQAQENRDRLAQEAATKQAALDAKNLADQHAAEEKQKEQQAGLDCDRLGANPTDAQRKAEGVTFDVLRLQADAAFDACLTATKQFPTELRYQYQLGRAAQFKDKKKAFELFTSLTNSRYASAFDNLGACILRDTILGQQASYFKPGQNLATPTLWLA
jgi:hypothetical protein